MLLDGCKLMGGCLTEPLDAFSLTFISLELQIFHCCLKCIPIFLTDPFPILLEEYWLHYFLCFIIYQVYISSTLSSDPKTSSILQALRNSTVLPSLPPAMTEDQILDAFLWYTWFLMTSNQSLSSNNKTEKTSEAAFANVAEGFTFQCKMIR